MCGFKVLDFAPILYTLLAYIVVVSLLDYLLLRKLRRLPWTWATFPLFIGGFSLWSYHAFYTGQLGALTRQEFVFQDYAPDGHGRRISLGCIRNTSNTPIRFSVPADHTLSLLSFDQGYSYSYYRPDFSRGQPVLLETGSGGDQKDIMLPAHIGAYRFFREDWPDFQQPLPLACALRETAGGLTGTVTPRMSHSPPIRVWIRYQGQCYTPGADRQLVRAQKPSKQVDVYGQTEPMATFEAFAEDDISRHYSKVFRIGSNPTLSICPHRGPHQAVVFALYETNSERDGLPSHSIVCIRQIVEVTQPGESP